MKQSPYIYLRGLRHAEHTVFGVSSKDKKTFQKFYRDPQWGKLMAYSSGQQVKRSIIEALDLPFAVITFNWEIDKKKNEAHQKEPHSPCDPSFADQLLGGYMKAESGNLTVKRRSPLSISAMRPLHPLLGGIENPTENLSFDRTSHPEHHEVKVYWTDGKKRGEEIPKEELEEWLTTNRRSLPNRAFIQDQTRASGLFVYDVAIDLRTLFCVSTNKLEPELFPETAEKLRAEGWIEGENVFGKCLLPPKDKREEMIKALANALINWRITSNQARTFSLMETVVMAISDNANQIAYAIRGELREDMANDKAVPRIDTSAKAEFFITPIAGSYIPGAGGEADALEKAEQYLVDQMMSFDYENQIEKTKVD